MFDSSVASPTEVVPEELAFSRCRPSGWLALELDSSAACPAGMDDADLVEAMVAFDRVASWASARQARVLAEFARRRPARDDPAAASSNTPSLASEFAPDEVALALRLSRVAAGARLDQAAVVERVLPDVLIAWEHGVLDAAKVRAIVEACRSLSADHARAVAGRVMPRAGEQTLGALRAALARAVIAVDPGGAAERHRHARRERRVVLGVEPEGMASLWALLPAPDAVAAHQHLGVLARALGAADPRGMDARRADLMADLLTGRRCALTHPRAAGCVEDASEAGDDPDTVDGGPAADDPIGDDPGGATSEGAASAVGAGVDGAEWWPAPLAREIAAGGTWTRLLTDPESGTLLDHGRTTYRPPTALADHIRARDVECRSPVCRRSAVDADLDHAVAWRDGGTTSEHNLYAGCRHDHRVKTYAPGWTVTQSSDGTITYVTPTGHRYTSRPHDYRPDPDRPPPAAQPPPSHDPPPDHEADPPPF